MNLDEILIKSRAQAAPFDTYKNICLIPSVDDSLFACFYINGPTERQLNEYTGLFSHCRPHERQQVWRDSHLAARSQRR